MSTEMERIDTNEFKGNTVTVTTDAGRAITITRRAWRRIFANESPEAVRLAILSLIDAQEVVTDGPVDDTPEGREWVKEQRALLIAKLEAEATR